MLTRTADVLRRAAVGLVGLALVGAGMGVWSGTATAATKTYPVKTSLDGRTVKDPDVAVGAKRVADMYPAGSSVTLVCQDLGPSYGGSDIWDLTDDGLWVPDAYVDTNSAGMVMSRCAIPKSYPAKADLNGRKNKGEAATAPGAVVDKYKSGQAVPVDCQALSGGAIWDHTTANLWVPDEYVKTGITGFVEGLPRCDTDGLRDGSGTGTHGRNTGPAGPTTGTRQQKVDRVIAAAKSQLGKGLLYSWGGGGKGGPSYGIHHYPDGNPANGDDYGRFGFDCSGFTLYAFWKGAGIDIGANTTAQYKSAHFVSLDALLPGDLIFWGDGDDRTTTTHVVLYLGGGQVLESAPPRDATSVHIRSTYGQANWMAHAVRYIT
ncbi:NlpC/P60 family protein [Umezawaea sp. Da 62-37]|uniref:C40 family peptidase n=1 Tax=Umezawaea sp. Da 62-37 TaxID=3075927 RepID=UPI0028F73D08|nr:NlpC/P60 family protein [Umezawaea sp. Da 62-37]WNV88901.1 NlpC/P60 family protein [Umezawaea sp. Da 62-37]